MPPKKAARRTTRRSAESSRRHERRQADAAERDAERSAHLFGGGCEVRIIFMGRGHIAGDVVVYLPNERVIATGDLMTNGVSYSGDAYLQDWIEAIGKVKTLDFQTTLPGLAFTGKEKRQRRPDGGSRPNDRPPISGCELPHDPQRGSHSAPRCLARL